MERLGGSNAQHVSTLEAGVKGDVDGLEGNRRQATATRAAEQPIACLPI
jgi:hypothetical protein